VAIRSGNDSIARTAQVRAIHFFGSATYTVTASHLSDIESLTIVRVRGTLRTPNAIAKPHNLVRAFPPHSPDSKRVDAPD